MLLNQIYLIRCFGNSLSKFGGDIVMEKLHIKERLHLKESALGELSIDVANVELMEKASNERISTVFDREKDQEPHCSYCVEGLSCRNCLMGPCRITKKADRGVCGATGDTMVARGLLRNICGGTSSHMDHARHAAHVLKGAAEGKFPYEIKDEKKLRTIAKALGIKGDGTRDLATKVAKKALEDLGRQEPNETMAWLKMHAPEERIETWKNLGVLPVGGDRTITESMHRTTMGSDADPVNLALGAIKSALVDGYCGLHMASDIQDILFGTPSPKMSKASFGVIEEDHVNIAVHGHIPILSEKIVEAAEKLQKEAKKEGANGINVVGICCTGNELLMRQGIPIAGNELNSELAIVSGALEAMAVDIQCIYPSVTKVAEGYHTKVITTSPIAKIPGAEHIEFDESRADEVAEEIVRKAIKNFKNRDPDKVQIPSLTTKAMVGFSVETIVDVLAKISPEDPLKPLIDNIANGNIKGAVAIVGCNNPKVKQDFMHVKIAEDLIEKDILVIATGCAAIAHAKEGLMSPEGYKKAGKGLQAVLKALGEAAGVEALPPVLHFGSCVDNSRIAVLLKALSDKLGVSIKDLPVAASAPEAATEKALSIGTWAVSLGITTHVNPLPRITGSEAVIKLLTEDIEGLLGGKFIGGSNPHKVAKTLEKHIEAKRKKLGLAA
jgi:carbon-monoxide dehydrogenase catalytic subunit